MSFAMITDQAEVRRIILLFSTKSNLIEEVCKKGSRAIICRTGYECKCGEGDFFCVSIPVGQQDNVLYEYVHACVQPRCDHVLSTAETRNFHEQCPLCEDLDADAVEAAMEKLLF